MTPEKAFLHPLSKTLSKTLSKMCLLSTLLLVLVACSNTENEDDILRLENLELQENQQLEHTTNVDMEPADNQNMPGLTQNIAELYFSYVVENAWNLILEVEENQTETETVLPDSESRSVKIHEKISTETEPYSRSAANIKTYLQENGVLLYVNGIHVEDIANSAEAFETALEQNKSVEFAVTNLRMTCTVTVDLQTTSYNWKVTPC